MLPVWFISQTVVSSGCSNFSMMIILCLIHFVYIIWLIEVSFDLLNFFPVGHLLLTTYLQYLNRIMADLSKVTMNFLSFCCAVFASHKCILNLR